MSPRSHAANRSLSMPAQQLTLFLFAAAATNGCGRCNADAQSHRADESSPVPDEPAEESVPEAPQPRKPGRAPAAPRGYLRAAGGHACRVWDGKVLCWGDNTLGALGTAGDRCGTGTCSRAPSPIEGLGGVKDFSLGEEHACAIGGDDKLRCWGGNESGQLALGREPTDQCIRYGHTASHGTLDLRTEEIAKTGTHEVPDSYRPCARAPTLVPGAPDVERVWASRQSTCVVGPRGTLHCAGARNVDWVVAVPSDCGEHRDRCTQKLTAAKAGDAPWVAFMTTEDGACKLDVDGVAECRGLHFKDAVRFANADAIAAGTLHACVLEAAGVVRCAGNPVSGLLGDGGPVHERQPNRVGGVVVRDATAIAVSPSHACALGRGGEVWCWGGNTYGQLGTGDRLDRASATRVDVPSAISVAAGYGFTCALERTGAVWCWGINEDGELGSPPGAETCTITTFFGRRARRVLLVTAGPHFARGITRRRARPRPLGRRARSRACRRTACSSA